MRRKAKHIQPLIVGWLALAAVTGLTDEKVELRANTARLQAQIDAAAAKGGGRVTVAKGLYRCGTLYLKSGVELHLEEGALLQGGGKSEDYDDAIPERHVYSYQGMDTNVCVETRKAFIFAEGATNIAITGKGTIDCRGTEFFDHSTVLWEHFWAKPKCARVREVVCIDCRGIRLEDATFRDPSVWAMWFRHCEDIVISRIRIDVEQKIINSDGIDLDGCRRVRIGDSYFHSGDDSIALRAIRDREHPEREVVCEDIVVTNCVFETLSNGVRIGCPSDDTIRNALFRNIVFRGVIGITAEQREKYLTEGDRGYLRTENLVFENWRIERSVQPIRIRVSDGVALRDFGHLTFRNIQAVGANPSVVQGGAKTILRDVRFENVNARLPAAKDMRYVEDVVVK